MRRRGGNEGNCNIYFEQKAHFVDHCGLYRIQEITYLLILKIQKRFWKKLLFHRYTFQID